MNEPQHYDRIGILSLKTVFPHIEEHFYKRGKYRVNINGFDVKVQSLRLRTFLKTGIECPCCHLSAQYFAVEKSKGNSGGFHLNLYGLDSENKEVIFTHDHILARSLGGEDNLSNSRTMCGPCNWEKGRLEGLLKKSIDPIEIAELNEKLERFKK